MIRLIAAVRAAITVLTLLAGPPVLLVMVAGNPWPAHPPSTTGFQDWLANPLRPAYVPDSARATAWLIWALFAGTIVTGGLLRARTRPRRLRWARLAALLPGPVQSIAATLLGAAAVTSVAGATPAHAAPAASTDTSLPAHADTVTASSGTPQTAGPVAQRLPAAPRTAVVRRGDTLWGIAGDRLGDPHRWTQIYRLNANRYPRMDGGDHIEPGWQLALPGTSAAPVHPTPRSGASTGSTNASPAPHAGHTASPRPSATAPGRAVAPAPVNGRIGPSLRPAASPDNHDGMALPGGSWLELGVATSIIAATALVWAHRRRRYTPRPASAQLRDPDPDTRAMPPVVNQIRRGLRGAAVPDVDQHDDLNPGAGPSCPHADLAARASSARDATDDRTTAPPSSHSPGNGSALDVGTSSETPRQSVSARAQSLGSIATSGGLGLTGPGAQAAARGFLTAALATGIGEASEQPTQVIMASALATALFGDVANSLSSTPRLRIITSMADALDILETHILHRSRLLDTYDADTVGGPAAPDTADPLSPVLLLAETTTDDQRDRLAALLAQGRRLDIHAVLLGPWPSGSTINVAADGTVSPDPTSPRGHSTLVGFRLNNYLRLGATDIDVNATDRLNVLSAAEAIDLITMLAEAHTGEAPSSRPLSTPAAAGEATAPPPVAATGGPAAEVIDPKRPTTAPATVAGPDELNPSLAGAAHGDEAPARGVEVTVLGQPEIVGLDPQRPPRKKAFELLVYLAVQDGAASADSILEDLLPEAPSSKAAGRLYTYVSDLRAVLRRTGGPCTYLTHPGHRYVLNKQAMTVDLWQMRDAIRDAERAIDPHQRIQALRRATDAYRGPLAGDEQYEWIEPYREAVRRQALDAFLALADALAGDPGAQVTVLDTAIRHDPYAEHIYQQAMRARAALGQAEAVTALHRDLRRALAEIDAEPSDATAALAAQLTGQVHRDGALAASRPGVNP